MNSLLPHASFASDSFLLAISTLFSIVNPVGSALVFSGITSDLTHAERAILARRIAGYAAAVLLTSLWLGSYVLAFFGVSLGALRVAGGLVVSFRAWAMLTDPQRREDVKHAEAAPAEGNREDVAFFPLTIPFTTGPGTISVAVALGAERPAEAARLVDFFLGVSLAALAIAAIVWVLFLEADRVMALLGESGARVVTRLVAFLLLAIGVQILAHGVGDLLEPLLRGSMAGRAG